MEFVVFFVTAAIALVGGVAMLATRNAVHSALFLLLNFLAISVLFLLLQSPFLFVIQITVYAGAIMVLFLFVVMLLGSERVEDRPDRLAWQRWLALGLGMALLVEEFIVGVLFVPSAASGETGAMDVISSPTSIGASLFTTYLLPFEVTGVLLLVAIIGVVVLQQRAKVKEAQMAPPRTAE